MYSMCVPRKHLISAHWIHLLLCYIPLRKENPSAQAMMPRSFAGSKGSQSFPLVVLEVELYYREKVDCPKMSLVLRWPKTLQCQLIVMHPGSYMPPVIYDASMSRVALHSHPTVNSTAHTLPKHTRLLRKDTFVRFTYLCLYKFSCGKICPKSSGFDIKAPRCR